MMLRTSSNSINPNLNMMLLTVRKNIGLLVLTVAAVLMVCPGFYLVRMEEYEMYSIDLVSVLAAILTIGAGALAVLYNVINFLFLYSKKSSDVFHALPLTRSGLLLSRWGAGIIMTVIPVAVGYIALAVIMLCFPQLHGDIGMVFGSLAYTVMTVLVCSTFSMLFIVCAGSAFDLVLSLAGLNLGLIFTGLILLYLMQDLLVGAFNADEYTALEWFSPVWYCGSQLVSFVSGECKLTAESIAYFIRTAVYSAVFLTASLLLYNNRKAERGGDAYAYRFIYIITSFIAGIVAAYAIGYIFTGSDYDWVFWMFAVLGAILFAVAFGAVTDRSFKYFRRSAVVGAASAAALALAFVILSTGGFGYSSYIPAKSSIQSVSVRYSGENVLYEDIEMPLEVHKKIVKNIDSLKNEYDYEIEAQSVRYTYNLKNGKTVERSFYLPVDDFAEELFALYSSDERLDSIEKSFTDAKPVSVQFDGDIDVINGVYKDDDEDRNWINVSLTPAEYRQVLEAYKTDVKNSDISIIKDDGRRTFYFAWENSGEDYIYYNYNLRLTSSFENTLAVLRSFNLEARVNADKEAY